MNKKTIIKKTRKMGQTAAVTDMIRKESKKYTMDDLISSPSTIIKFFVIQGKAEPSMLEDARVFYKTFSTGSWKKQTLNKKRFTREFLKAMNFYNSIMK